MEFAFPPLTELDRWLAEREARVVGLKPEVAAGIIWAKGEPSRTRLSIVYLHGYTATRREIYPVTDRVAAALGANLFYARLTGHGTGPDGHRTARFEDWERDGLEALALGRQLGEHVVVVATSTGAALATWLTAGPAAEKVAAMVLVSPNLTPKDRRSEMLLLPGKEWILRRVMGPMVTIPPVNEGNGRYWDLVHHSHSLLPMMALVHRARTRNFRRWAVPALVVYDPRDDVVDERVSKKLFSLAPPSLVRLYEWKSHPDDHRHVLAGDALSPHGTDRMVELSVTFLSDVLSRLP